jgi:hypothetical protein
VFKVFISSSAAYEPLLRAVANTIRALKDFTVLSCEDTNEGTASPPPATAASLDLIEKADVVVLIFAGNPRDKQTRVSESGLELEYKHAKAGKKPVFLFNWNEEPFVSRFAEHRISMPLETFTSPENLAAQVEATLRRWQNLTLQARAAPEAFEIVFAPQLTKEQVAASLEALANYYRACGGAGLQADIELADVLVEAPSDVLA